MYFLIRNTVNLNRITCCNIIKQGGLVAFPTETVYGLGANALDEEAARKTYTAKGRPSDNPLIVHIAEKSALEEIVEELPEETKALTDRFWPGPLTLIVKKNARVPYGISSPGRSATRTASSASWKPWSSSNADP